MHVRASTKRQKDKTYRYVQIVQSYRRKDGVTGQKVLGSLGDLPRQTEQNLRLALAASREDKAVIIAPESPGLCEQAKVKANLRYLDIAVMLEVWRGWGLDDLFREFIADGELAMSASDVVAALTLQRCAVPGSKLFAQRWFPTTALPELLGIEPQRFNNTRIHRVLKAVHDCDAELQKRLPDKYQSRHGAFAMAFMDVTNTYFEGHGCEMAESTRTKEGHRNKRAIGIVLLANEHGYPLRWKVVPGKTKDHLAMGGMVGGLRGIEWLGTTPVVFDRAMGRESTVTMLLGSDLRFLTAAPVNSIESHTRSLPHRVFSELGIKGTEAAHKDDIGLAAATARKAGMEKVDEHLFVLDLGVVPFEPSAEVHATTSRGRCASIKERLRLARELQAKLDAGEYESQGACARALGLTASRVSQVLKLLRLAPDLQERILECPDDFRLSEQQLKPALKQRDPDRQRELLAGMLPASPAPASSSTEVPGGSGADGQSLDPDGEGPDTRGKRLRLVAYFNPQMFVDQRVRAREHIEGLNRFIQELNEELSGARKSREEEPTRRKIIRELEKKDYVDAFEVSLEPITVTTKAGSQIASFRCKLSLKPDEWARRRRYDGFVLLLGHPELKPTASELALMYRAKDAVEKDFETIKSVVKLRPLYHKTDPKVEAHVTICMLALLLLRTLEHKLRNANVALTAPACREILKTCHLNQMKPLPGGRPLYSVTEASTAQREVLDALELGRLVDDEAVARGLTPRFVST